MSRQHALNEKHLSKTPRPEINIPTANREYVLINGSMYAIPADQSRYEFVKALREEIA